MPAPETLKEYLVRLGWDIDELGYKNAEKQIKQFTKNAKGIGKGISASFVSAGIAVSSFLVAVNSAMVGLMTNVAQADLSVERFARRMWTSEENARSFTAALNAMGASMEDIYYMTPEEFENFIDLKNYAQQLKAPTELQNTLRLIRDIQHEFNRLKVIANYGTQWVVYYLGKYLGVDMQNLQEAFTRFNDWLAKNIPVWTEKIASFFYVFYRLGKTAVTFISKIISLLDKLPTNIKIAGGAVAGFLALLKAGPIGWFIAALMALLLLLDDFQTWQRGGKSSLGPLWEQLSSIGKNLDFSQLDVVNGKLETLFTTAGDVAKALGDLFLQFLGWAEDTGVLQKALDILIGTFETIIDLLQWILDLVLVLTGNFDKLNENSWFRKVTAMDEEGNVRGWKTAANVGMGILDAPANALNTLLGTDFFTPVSNFTGYNYESGKQDAAVASGAGSFSGSYGAGRGTTNQTNTQTNTINVYAAPGQSEQTIADKTTQNLTNMRPWFSSFGN